MKRITTTIKEFGPENLVGKRVTVRLPSFRKPFNRTVKRVHPLMVNGVVLGWDMVFVKSPLDYRFGCFIGEDDRFEVEV